MSGDDVKELAVAEERLAREIATLRHEFAAELVRGKQALNCGAPAAFALRLGLTASLDSVEDWLEGRTIPVSLWNGLDQAWKRAFADPNAAATLERIHSEWRSKDQEWRSVRAKLRVQRIDPPSKLANNSIRMDEKFDTSAERGYEWSRVNLVYMLGPDRLPLGTFEHRLVRATRDGTDEVQISYRQTNPLRPGYNMEYDVTYGGEPRYEPEDGGYVRCHIHVDPPLIEGEERMIVTQRRYTGTAEALPYWFYGPGHGTTNQLRLAVQFSEPAVPERVWWFEDVISSRLPPRYIEANQLALNGLHAVEHRFDRPNPDRACGIAWTW